MIISPVFCHLKVNYSGIVRSLSAKQITHNVISRVLGVNRRTVFTWSKGANRPIYKTGFLLIDFACRYLPERVMNECGVTQ